MLVACMILLCNHERTVYEKPYAYREPMCASENCQLCGESKSWDRYISSCHKRDSDVEHITSGLINFSIIQMTFLPCHQTHRWQDSFFREKFP
jgi:hypothetical protein